MNLWMVFTGWLAVLGVLWLVCRAADRRDARRLPQRIPGATVADYDWDAALERLVTQQDRPCPCGRCDLGDEEVGT